MAFAMKRKVNILNQEFLFRNRFKNAFFMLIENYCSICTSVPLLSTWSSRVENWWIWLVVHRERLSKEGLFLSSLWNE